ncbi:DUF1345 domain-containing protein [Arthrobacter sp. GCM10027362]|uniref:DUF1345 domain-containing protein n=1 Tax=Arthrobacter sp. GCM10027362 TaxID=3273379 RepID=UPI00363DA760
MTAVRNFNKRVHRSRLRLLVMAGAGLVTAAVVGSLGSWQYAPAMGWAAASLVYLAWVWAVIGRLDAAATAAHARREDPGKTVSDVLVLAATVASFGGVALVLLDAGTAVGGAKIAIICLALGSVVLSWFLVHTLYTLRYALLFYQDGEGVEFNQDKPPGYADFAYLAFTVGMTFQVSDTNLKAGGIRAAALRQALLSYLLGAIVLAMMINLVSGLIR